MEERALRGLRVGVCMGVGVTASRSLVVGSLNAIAETPLASEPTPVEKKGVNEETWRS